MEWLLAVFRSYLLFLFIPTLGAQPSFIREPPSPKNVTEGDNVTLSWIYNLDGTLQQSRFELSKSTADGSLTGIFIQYPNNNPDINSDFKDTFHVQIISVNQTSVTITGISRSDSGKYQYKIAVGFKAATSDVEVFVLYPANITTFFAGNQTVNESESLNLTCEADGSLKPSITWTRLSDDREVFSPLNITGKQVEGEYKCTASNNVGNPDSRTVYISVQNYRPVHSLVVTNLTDNIVVVNTTFSITCSAQANPPAKYRLYKGNEFVNDSDNDGVITTSVSERVKQVNYSCIPFNFYGDGRNGVVTVTVHYAPGGTKLISDPSNTTVLRKSSLQLRCEADASPEAEFELYFNGNFLGSGRKGIFFVTVESDGAYTCIPSNIVGTGKNASVTVTFVVPSIASVLPKEDEVVDGNSLNLTCEASGKPEPSIKWTKIDSLEVLSTQSRLTVHLSRNNTVNNMIQYQCTASNGVGTPATARSNIIVHYPAMIPEPENVTLTVTVGQEVDISCNGEGYPKPTIILTAIYINGSYQNLSSEHSKLTTKADSPFEFLCTVENYLAKHTKWFHLVLNAKKFEIEITVDNKDCSEGTEVVEPLREHVIKILKNQNISIENITSLSHSCGSVTVYFSLEFDQNVSIEKVLKVLKNAASPAEKSFGDLEVNPKSIQAISPERIPAMPTTPPPTERFCNDGFLPEGNGCPWSKGFICLIFFVLVVAVLVPLALIYYMYKRRKCRKDSRVHSSRSEERPFSSSNENDYSQVQSGYAETGPRSTEMANLDHHLGEEGASTAPNYAVGDKAKKKNKKKDKKAGEMKLTEHQFAVVDKSRKKTKLKNEPDATYAEVDLQKKSEKKPKPGEVLYADLDEFHQMKRMPEVSTSPKALAPIKRPEAYAETQYADITQFLRGDPEDPGAELPKDSTIPDVSNTTTGSKKESSGNTGDGVQPTNETGF